MHCIALHYIPLHYITLHYITYTYYTHNHLIVLYIIFSVHADPVLLAKSLQLKPRDSTGHRVLLPVPKGVPKGAPQLH